MYSQSISDASLARAAASLGIEVPERLPLPYLSQVVSHLDSLVEIERDRISGLPRHIEFKRPLKPDEAALIRAQRLLCKYDFQYWATRFHRIRSFDGQLISYVPNIAQRMILDIWGEMEEKGMAIEMIQDKARQLGVSVNTEAAAQHRPQFWSRVNAVVASASPEQSEKMAGMMLLSLQNQPWWLLPDVTLFRIGALIEFGRQNSSITVQHGAQTTGISRGTTPNVIHLSEVASYADAESIIESSLFRAVHPSPNVLMILESTAEGLHNWWHTTWEYSKENWTSGRARLRPIFLPWFIGTDLYPTPTWLRGHPIPPHWQPLSITVRHACAAASYVRTNDLLRKYLGPRWEMPRAQMWFWECGYLEARAKKTLNLWYQEMASNDGESFQSSNISAFDHETIAEYQAGACEPLAVFGLHGPDVALRLQPDQADLDSSLPTIEIPPITDEGLPYSLVPLKWDSCSQSDPFGKFLIWEFPEPEQTYGIGIDTSDGIGEDRTVISVLRKGTMEANDALVAQFISPYVNAFDLPPFAYAIAAFYSPLDSESGEACQAKMVIEIAGNGESTQLELRKRGWRNFHQWVRYDAKKLKESRATRFGWFTNSWSRPMMLDWLLKAIKDSWLDIPSTYFVQEMKDLERNTDRQSMKAAHGGHDDQIMSLGIVFFSMWALELRQARASSPGDTDFKGANPLTGRRISRPRLTYGSNGLLDPAVAAKVRDPSRYPSYSAPEQASPLSSDSAMRRYMIEDGERKIEEAEQGEREELYERIGAHHE